MAREADTAPIELASGRTLSFGESDAPASRSGTRSVSGLVDGVVRDAMDLARSEDPEQESMEDLKRKIAELTRLADAGSHGRASESGSFRGQGQSRRGVSFVERAREIEPGSRDEQELAARIEKLEDLHEGAEALMGLARSVERFPRGFKWLAALLSISLLGSPLVDRAVSPTPDIVQKLDMILAEQKLAAKERRALASWEWEQALCAQGKLDHCLETPPPSIRILAAQHDQENGQ